jgi:class 3 adenylate cyclase/tetratricopeptide (TPR) repeat protein
MSGVSDWLARIGLGQYAAMFEANAIDEEVLPLLEEGDLEKLGVPLGHRKKILRAITPPRAAPKGERRQVTVFFFDLAGSTEISQKLDPEDLRELVRRYRDAVAERILHYEGFIASYMGDGVMAYFGWPRAHEDDAQRAVQAGLEVIAALETVAVPEGIQLRGRVGIATGQVVIGDLVGDNSTETDAVVGQTPNLAARLQGAASPGEVVIEDATRQLLQGSFELSEMGAVPLKGFAEPVRVWRARAPRPVASRFEARETAAAPLVGRDRELSRLREKWREARAGAGQAVILSGEAGIGKSRLAWALRGAIAREESRYFSFQCSPYHIGSPLYPVIVSIERTAGFTHMLGPEGKRARLSAWMEEAQPSREEKERWGPVLAELVSLPAAGTSGMSAEQRRRRTIETLLELFGRIAQLAPLIVLVEDIHWADATTLDLLRQLVGGVAEKRAMLLLTHRSDWRAPFPAAGHVTGVVLDRLDDEAARAMVEELSGGRVSAEACAKIAARADGIPLFLEELTRAAVEGGGNHVPESLEGLLLARLDRLGRAKVTAQAGAVIGREFEPELLAGVLETTVEDLAGDFSALQRAHILRSSQTAAGKLYVFRHALIQDAAYQSLLRAKRRALHGRAAVVLEEQFPATAQARPEIVAHHLMESGSIRRSTEFWQRAGELAASRSANVEAASHFATALKLLRTLPREVETLHRELSILAPYGGTLRATQGFGSRATGEVCQRANELARELGDSHQLLTSLNGLYSYHLVRGEHREAGEVAEELLRTARQEHDETFEMIGLRASGAVKFHTGRLREARERLQQALDRYSTLRHVKLALVYGSDHASTCACFLSLAKWLMGETAAARELQSWAVKHTGNLDHAFSHVQAMAYLGLQHLLAEEGEQVRAVVEKMTAMAAKHSFAQMLAFAGFLEAVAQMDRAGTKEQAERVEEKAEAWNRIAPGNYRPFGLTKVAEARLRVGQYDEALQRLREAEQVVQSSGETWSEAELHRVRAAVLSGAGAHGGAVEAVQQAIACACEQEAQMWRLRAAITAVEVLGKVGEAGEGLKLLEAARAALPAGCKSRDTSRAKRLLNSGRTASAN